MKTEQTKQPIQSLKGTIVFCMVDTPRDCYEKSKGQEYKCGIVVDEDTADAFEEIYPKQAAKKVKVVDFEEVYKCNVPSWAEGEKNVYVITLRKNAKLANGEPVPDKYKPHVFEQTVSDKGVVTRTDVTLTKLVANGSVGSISIDHWESEHGNVARLKNILVTDFIEYEKQEGSNYEAGNEFDEEQEAPKPVQKTVKETVKPAKASKNTKPSAEDDSDPF